MRLRDLADAAKSGRRIRRRAWTEGGGYSYHPDPPASCVRHVSAAVRRRFWCDIMGEPATCPGLPYPIAESDLDADDWELM